MAVVIDDTDRRIKYGGSGWWSQATIAGEFNLTRHGVSSNLLQTVVANVEFDFIGSSVEVYGSLDVFGTLLTPMSYTARFSVDNGPSTAFSPPIATVLQHGKQFYSSPPLSDGEHTLNIEITVPPPLGATFWLDSIHYMPVSRVVPAPNPPHLPDTTAVGNPTTTAPTVGPVSPTIQSTSITTPTSSGSMLNATITSSKIFISSLESSLPSSSLSQSDSSHPTPPGSIMPSQVASPTEMPLITSSFFASSTPSAPAAGSDSKTPTGAIVGAVLGGVSLVIIVASLLYCWRRKPRVVGSFTDRDRSTSTTVIPYTGVHSFAKPEKAARRGSIIFNNDSPPPWSPSESSNVQGITTSLLASNTLVSHTPRHSLMGPTGYYAIPGGIKSAA